MPNVVHRHKVDFADGDRVPISHNRKIQAAFEKEGVTSTLIESAEAGH